MAEKSTYIKLDRNMVRWKWWKNRNTLQVFIWLLFEANVADHEFEHEIIHRGEVVTSLPTLCKSTGLTTQQVRTSLQHLISTGEITCRSNNKYRVISIVNYSTYQGESTGKKTVNQQTTNRQLTDKQQQYKNDKNIKNEKNNKGRSAPRPPSGENPSMPDRDAGTVDDIPIEHRDGTYHSFKSYAEYYDWRNQ